LSLGLHNCLGLRLGVRLGLRERSLRLGVCELLLLLLLLLRLDLRVMRCRIRVVERRGHCSSNGVRRRAACSEVGVRKRLFGGETFGGVELKETLKQVDGCTDGQSGLRGEAVGEPWGDAFGRICVKGILGYLGNCLS
jgi:hypothetical protein